MASKAQIRKEFKEKRKSLLIEQVNDKSRTICDKLLGLSLLSGAKNILAYSSIQNEVDLMPLIESLKSDINVYLPKVNNDIIKFYKYIDYRQLQKGSYDILEPIEENEYFSQPNSIILVPGIAFSTKGERIGFGKGYYDRFLSEHSELTKIGIAYDWQITDCWEIEQQDINMDIIISEKREGWINDKIRNDM